MHNQLGAPLSTTTQLCFGSMKMLTPCKILLETSLACCTNKTSKHNRNRFSGSLLHGRLPENINTIIQHLTAGRNALCPPNKPSPPSASAQSPPWSPCSCCPSNIPTTAAPLKSNRKSKCLPRCRHSWPPNWPTAASKAACTPFGRTIRACRP